MAWIRSAWLAALAGAAFGCANDGGSNVRSANAAPPALGLRGGQVQRAVTKSPDWDLLGLTRSSPRPLPKGRPDWDLLGLTSPEPRASAQGRPDWDWLGLTKPQPKRNIKITPRRREPSPAEQWDGFCGNIRKFFGFDKAAPPSLWPGAPGPEDFRSSLPRAPSLAPPILPPPQGQPPPILPPPGPPPQE